MSITQREHQWGKELVPFQITKVWGNPLPFVPQYVSHLMWAGLELNQGGAVGRCPLWWAVPCSHPAELGCLWLLYQAHGQRQELVLCFLFSGSCWLCAFPEQSQLCCALQLGSRTAACSGIGPVVFGQVLLLLWFTLSPPILVVAKGTLAKGENNC